MGWETPDKFGYPTYDTCRLHLFVETNMQADMPDNGGFRTLKANFRMSVITDKSLPKNEPLRINRKWDWEVRYNYLYRSEKSLSVVENKQKDFFAVFTKVVPMRRIDINVNDKKDSSSIKKQHIITFPNFKKLSQVTDESFNNLAKFFEIALTTNDHLPYYSKNAFKKFGIRPEFIVYLDEVANILNDRVEFGEIYQKYDFKVGEKTIVTKKDIEFFQNNILPDYLDLFSSEIMDEFRFYLRSFLEFYDSAYEMVHNSHLRITADYWSRGLGIGYYGARDIFSMKPEIYSYDQSKTSLLYDLKMALKNKYSYKKELRSALR